ncbi:hypothetical protein LSAT2_020000, partial [Lamellibrachia satsuma]
MEQLSVEVLVHETTLSRGARTWNNSQSRCSYMKQLSVEVLVHETTLSRGA